jgi:hypothetical protein
VNDYSLNIEEKGLFEEKKELIERELSNQTDKRISKFAPTNNEKLKALTEFCPEFIARLHKLSKDDQGQIMGHINYYGD